MKGGGWSASTEKCKGGGMVHPRGRARGIKVTTRFCSRGFGAQNHTLGWGLGLCVVSTLVIGCVSVGVSPLANTVWGFLPVGAERWAFLPSRHPRLREPPLTSRRLRGC